MIGTLTCDLRPEKALANAPANAPAAACLTAGTVLSIAFQTVVVMWSKSFALLKYGGSFVNESNESQADFCTMAALSLAAAFRACFQISRATCSSILAPNPATTKPSAL